MRKNKYDISIKAFQDNRGILRTVDAVKLGIPKHQVYEMEKAGILIKEERGLYRLAEMEPLENPDLVKVSILAPKAVICLITALYFHGLTTQIPHSVQIALPQNLQQPKISYPPVEVVWLSEKPFRSGIESHDIDGVKVSIYSPEKTITDCYKFRKKVGEDVALEALKDYMRLPNPNIGKLLEYAKINRVEKLIKPHLEAIL